MARPAPASADCAPRTARGDHVIVCFCSLCDQPPLFCFHQSRICMTDSLLQAQTPLLDALRTLAQKPHAAFYAPGHKRGQGVAFPLQDLLGTTVFRSDLPELPELDNLFAPQGAIAQAQQLAAEAFGAQQSWFLINGSTCGIMAAILATCGAGDKIILPRNVHQSAVSGLVLSGAVPVFINPEYDPQTDLTYSITSESVAAAIAQYPEAKAVMIVYPTYHGIGADVEAIAHLAHQHDLPLLVDEAHGAHLAFHPDLPPSALSCGADLSVQSIHKVLGALTQASMLHCQGNRIDRQKISKALQLLQSTSPSYLLLASLDAARQQMALHGQQLLAQTLQLATQARQQIAQIPGLSVLDPPDALQPRPGFKFLDCTRLTVNLAQLELDGFAADELLHTQLAVTAELPLREHLTFIITFGNRTQEIVTLVKALATLAQQYRASKSAQRRATVALPPLPTAVPQLSPRQAYFAPTQHLPLQKAVAHISAELVCPYPPGIPVLMPGEVVRREGILYLQQVQALGARITGCSDPTLKTLQVVRC